MVTGNAPVPSNTLHGAVPEPGRVRRRILVRRGASHRAVRGCDDGRARDPERARMTCLTGLAHTLTPYASGQSKKPHGKSSQGAGERRGVRYIDFARF